MSTPTPEEKALALPLRAVKLNEPGGFEFGWCAVDAEDRVIGYCMTETQAKQLVAPFLSSETGDSTDAKDAARYRWLRNHPKDGENEWWPSVWLSRNPQTTQPLQGGFLDDEVDRAIRLETILAHIDGL